MLLDLLLGDLDLGVELFGLFLGAFALCTCDHPVHLLNVIVGVVLEFLLPLGFHLQLIDGCLEVPRCRQSRRDGTDVVGLLCSEFEELLRLLE